MRITITEAEKAEIEAALAIPKRDDRWPVLAAIVDRLCPFMRAADLEMVWDELVRDILQHAEVAPDDEIAQLKADHEEELRRETNPDW